MTRTRLLACTLTVALLLTATPANAVSITDPATPAAAADAAVAGSASTVPTAATVAPTAPTAAQTNETVSPDPASDRLGWENGYWYNESLSVSNLDGLNESEREIVVARSMARIERVRQKEFETTVPVTTISRETYRQRTSQNYTETFETFDNVKFEAMFMVGENRDSLAVQRANRGSSVLGFYDTENDTITIITDGSQPVLDGEGTLAHELVHALQDQYFNLSSLRASTRDGFNARNGVVEGEANFVQRRYTTRCGEEWSCLTAPAESGGSNQDLHFGIYFLQFFPYSDGPDLIRTLYRQGGWDAVDRAFENIPETSDEVIYPERYDTGGDSVTVNLTDSSSGDWERLQPEPQRSGQQRPDYATLGQSALSSMFMYTAYAGQGQPLVGQREFLNIDASGNVNRSDPINYDLQYTSGWVHDRLHVYRSPSAGANETAYVWRLTWQSTADAEEFVDGYRRLLQYWGGSEVASHRNTWRIEEGQFADAFYIDHEGDTVTIVNAPTVDALSAVRAGAAPAVDDGETDTATPTTENDDGDATTTEPQADTAGGGGDTDGDAADTDAGTATGTDAGTAASGPGFTVGLALVALLAVALLARRRR